MPESCHGCLSSLASVVCLLVLDRGKVPARLQQALAVEPGDPLQRRELHILDLTSGPPPPNDLRLEETDQRLRQGVVVRVADAPTDSSMPASAKRSVYRIDKSWEPCSPWCSRTIRTARSRSAGVPPRVPHGPIRSRDGASGNPGAVQTLADRHRERGGDGCTSGQRFRDALHERERLRAREDIAPRFAAMLIDVRFQVEQ